jgi:hypothetical protein
MSPPLTSEPVENQYYPGGPLQQVMDWAQANFGNTGATGPASSGGITGPTGGFQIGNIKFNWGTIAAQPTVATGPTGVFAIPYTDGAPMVIVSDMPFLPTGTTGGLVTVSKTGLQINGTGPANWIAVGT